MTTNVKMNYREYFIYEFLERAHQKVSTISDAEIQRSIIDFIQAIKGTRDLLEGIEMLAQYPGTSDLSIFFADILENLSIYHPDEVNQKLEELSQDLIEMFKLLKSDEQWNDSMERFKRDVGGIQRFIPEFQMEKMSFDEFCEYWLKSRFNELFSSVVRDDDQMELGKSLFNILIAEERMDKLIPQVADSVMQSVLDQLKNILEYKSQSVDDYFLANYFQNVDGFIDDFIQLLDAKTDLVKEFLSRYSEMELEEMEVKAKSLEEKIQEKRTKPSTAMPLDSVISEYLKKEFEETVKELKEILNDLSSGEKDELWKEFKDNADYLKEIGTIHNIPFLAEVGEYLKNIHVELTNLNLSVDDEIAKNIHSFLDQLQECSSSFETGEFDKIRELTEKQVVSLNNLFTEKAIAMNIEESRFGLNENLAMVIEQFNTAHQYYWGLVSKEYALWLSHRDRQKHADKMIGWLDHLAWWYSLLGFTHINNAIQYLEHIFSTLRYGEVSTELDAYIQEFLITLPGDVQQMMKEDIEQFIQKVRSEGISVGESKIGLSGVRTKLLAMLWDYGKTFIDKFDLPIWVDFIEDTMERLSLLKEKEMEKSFQQLREIIVNNYETWKEEDFIAKVRPLLGDWIVLLRDRDFIRAQEKLDFINDSVLSYKFEQEMRQSSPTIMLVEEEAEDEMPETSEAMEEEEELESLLKEAVIEEEAEPIPVVEEEITDEQLEEIFIREAENYMKEIREGIERLEKDQNDTDAINRIFRNAHSLKGSARMMGKVLIGDVAETIEKSYEILLNEKLSPDGNLIRLTSELVHDLLTNPEKQQLLELFKQAWNDFLKKPAEVTEEETVDFIYLQEQDPEILQLFQEEAGSVIKQLKGISRYISEFAVDAKIREELDQALHKVYSAAKMLGFSEISEFIHKAEELIPRLEKSDQTGVQRTADVLAQMAEVIDTMIHEGKVRREKYEALQEAIKRLLSGEGMDISTIEEKQKFPQEGAIQDIPSRGTEIKETRDDVYQLFLNEVGSSVESIRSLSIELELHPDDREKIYQVFRLMHTIKGAASMVGLTRLEQLVHKFEDILESYYNSQRGLPVLVMNLLKQTIEELEFILKHLSRDRKEVVSSKYPVILTNLGKIEKSLGKVAETDEGALKEPTVQPVVEVVSKEQEVVKISIAKLDELLNNSVELVITNNELLKYIQRLSEEVKKLENERRELTELKALSQDIFNHYEDIYNLVKKIAQDKSEEAERSSLLKPSLENLKQKLEQLYDEIRQLESGIKDTMKEFEVNFEKVSKISNRLYDDILQVRMVPISLLFDLFPKAVREIARKYDKKVALTISGGETELDRSMVEHLFEPLLHIVRNAIDHGIESPEERVEKGKPEEGNIQLIARQEKDRVIITIADDGKGLDIEKIKEQILAKGLLTAEEVEKLHKDDLIRYIFQPGFSTREAVSELSGRGIGLDVVERQIRKLKGEIFVETEKDKGTRFHLRFPITLSVTQCILIREDDTLFGIPMYYVENTIDFDAAKLQNRDRNYFYEIGSESILLKSLAHLMNLSHEELDFSSGQQAPEFTVILLNARGQKIGLLVRKVERRAELIVKPLSPNLQNYPFITGGALLPDASIVLILDVEEILEKSLMHVYATKEEEIKDSVVYLIKLSKKNRIKVTDFPFILLVDDSEQIRSYLSKLLTTHGMEVKAVSSIRDAEEVIKTRIPDLIIVDLELPEVSGYEFILKMREKNEYQKIPFMFFTGKKKEMIENLAKDLNAIGYILKPFKDEELIEKLQKLFLKSEKGGES